MRHETSLRRRDFIKTGIGVVCCASQGDTPVQAESETVGGLIERIERNVIFNGRETGPTWFQPRGCMVPSEKGDLALMTLQPIGGSDLYGPVHWTVSKNMGATWTIPRPIPGLGRNDLADGWQEGVCDVVPEYHPKTQTVLAVGHNVYYHGAKLARPQRPRCPIYVVRSADGVWSRPKKLEWDDPRGKFIYTGNCSHRVTLANGRILFPLSFAAVDGRPRSVASALCDFDGKKLTISRVGNELSHPVRRGLLEPSLIRFDGLYYMTIRAEDDRGYVSVSEDGLDWRPPRPWTWDDGSPLITSSTQQHWLPHSEGLFLIYTRKDSTNEKVIRWRTPLYMAEVDRRKLRLIRKSERTVFPLSDGELNPKHAALLGNFHTQPAGQNQSWITVGENRSRGGWKGDTLLARIHWRRSNRLAS